MPLDFYIGSSTGTGFYRIGLFPTCQVRVVRFYQSCPSPPSPPPPPILSPPLLLLCLANSSPISSPTSARSGHCWTSTAGSQSEWARLDLNRQVLSAVGTAGPQPPGSERSGRWTSTASFRAQWAPLDLQSSVGTAGPQPGTFRA